HRSERLYGPRRSRSWLWPWALAVVVVLVCLLTGGCPRATEVVPRDILDIPRAVKTVAPSGKEDETFFLGEDCGQTGSTRRSACKQGRLAVIHASCSWRPPSGLLRPILLLVGRRLCHALGAGPLRLEAGLPGPQRVSEDLLRDFAGRGLVKNLLG